MARIRLREGEAEPQGIIALRNPAGIVQRLAREAAVADHIEAPVPFRRKAHFERDLGCDQTRDAAVRRRVACRRHRRRSDLHDLL